MQDNYFLKKLKEDFSRRTRTNPAFSLRAYAKYLGLHPSTLSQVLLGNRPLPQKTVSAVLMRLRLNARERTLFKESLEFKKTKLDQIPIHTEDRRYLLDETYFQIIAEWEHYAVLTLFDCKEFEATQEDIQSRLNISKSRAEVVLANLLKYGLIMQDKNGKIVKAYPSVRTTEDVASQALQASHFDTLELGKRKLEEVSVELRDFSSMMVAVDSAKLPETKQIIREFRRKMMALLKDGRKSEVYQLAIQFYPITKIKFREE
ncbi:MAG: DUF4423 domain-containing protein [Pseudobdellovibrionaceae bacterium]